MRSENICLVMTGCISPSAQVVKLCVKDKDYREQQYIEAICFYIEKTNIKNIVFCDNSDIPAKEILHQKAREKGKNFEWLSFKGDHQKAQQLGKGYGEGEILKYAIYNSKLIKDCSYMAKVTGRLKLLNINVVLKLLLKSAYHFSSYFDDDRHLFIDTRFFVTEIDSFRNDLLDVYEEVNDSRGFYFEYAIAEKIQDNGIRYRNFPLALDIAGVSGSTGYSYCWTRKMLIIKSVPLFMSYFFHIGKIRRATSELGEELVWGDYFWHNNFRMLEGKHIVLYGAGIIGRKFYTLCKEHCSVVAWVDENYANIRRIQRTKIISPAAIKKYQFDYFIIAVKSEIMVEHIRNYAVNMGVPADKIVWGLPIV